MRREPAWRRYLRFRGADAKRDVDDELRFHLEMLEEEYRRGGMSTGEARAAAAERFGSVPRARDACYQIGGRRQRHAGMAERLASVGQDARYALRQLRRAPAFTAAVVLTLALGIGANAAVFSLIHATLLRPLPGIDRPEQLVEIASFSLSFPAFRDYRDAVAPHARLAAFRERRMALRAGDRDAVATAAIVSDDYFAVLGARAGIGRVLGAADGAPGADPVAVVSDRLWRRTFDADTAVLGTPILLNGRPVTVVGVAQAAFRGTRVVSAPDLWLPIAAWPAVAPSGYADLSIEKRGWSWLTAIGRLAPGATPADAQKALAASARRQLELFPRETEPRGEPTLAPARRTIAGARAFGALSGILALLAGVVSLVLLIACANIANLLLARTASRRREMAVRIALGAGRGRLRRQMLTEAVVLGALGGIAGLGAAWVTIQALARLTLSAEMSLDVLHLGLHRPVVAYSAAVALLTALAFGVAPAWQASRAEQVSALKEGTGRAGRARSRLRDALLVAQVAMSLVLLAGAGLFVRSLGAALSADLGFRAERIALVAMEPGLARYDAPRAARFLDDAERRIAALPGVHRAAWTVTVPMTPDVDRESARIDGYVPVPNERVQFEVNLVGRDFFRAFGIPLVAGRAFEEGDRAGARKVAIVNETAARRYWAGRDPIGGRILMGRGDTLTVVGVAKTVKYHALDEDPAPYLYGPIAQHPRGALGGVTLVAQTTADPELALPIIRRALAGLAPDVPAVSLSTFDDRFAELLLPQRAGAGLLGAFALLALAVALVGVYGVVAYGVSQRRREMGIRMALGARPLALLGLVLRENMRLVMLGVALGGALALAFSRAASGMLYGVSANDPVAFLSTALGLTAAAALAAYLPARRATRVDPASILRAE